MTTIKYLEPHYDSSHPIPDNSAEVVAFIGPQPPCPTCGGSGEYESEYGPKGCNPCNSRLIPFVDAAGRTRYADWGDSIERREDGLHLISELPPLQPLNPASSPKPTPELVFNINHYVRVKLTPHGRECLRKNHDELKAHYGGKLPFEFSPPDEDAGGWSKWQLHALIDALGSQVGMGRELPFETDIRIITNPE